MREDGRPEVQDIFASCYPAWALNQKLSSSQKKAAQDIIICRTEQAGAHVEYCDHCGIPHISYNSCRNRHCPKCQTFAKEKWIDEQRQNMLNVPFFHVVFTVPAILNSLFLASKKKTYDLLFTAASQTILQLSADPKLLGARPGIISVLHTWGQNLEFHPHIHMIVTGGGLTDFGTWKNSKSSFFLPVHALSKVFRGKFMDLLKKEFPKLDKDLENRCWDKAWNVYCKPPFAGPESVIAYLGRYTHRVAISNNRIISFENGRVSFKWRDYADGSREKIMTLDAEEFIRRFLLHILPPGFRKIRYYGLFAARDKKKRLARCRRLTATPQPAPPLSDRELLVRMLGPDFDLCPVCRIGRFSRDPPETV